MQKNEDEPESSFELLLDRTLLRADETSDHDLNSEIDIVSSYVVPQMHLRTRLAHSNHAFEMSNGDRVRSCRERFATEIGVESRDLVLIHLVQERSHSVAGVLDVLFEQILRNDLLLSSVHTLEGWEGGEDVHRHRGAFQR